MPEVRVIKVVAMLPAGAPAVGGSVKTDALGELTVTTRKDWRTLEMGFVRGWVMSVKVEKGVVLLSWPADTDHVRAVGSLSDPGDRVVIDLMKRQTFLYLSRSDPRFRLLYKQVEEAVKSQASVSVAVVPGGEVIEDLR